MVLIYSNESNPAALKLIIGKNFAKVKGDIKIVNLHDCLLSKASLFPYIQINGKKICIPNAALCYLFPPSRDNLFAVNELLEWEATFLSPILACFFGSSGKSAQIRNILSVLLEKLNALLQNKNYLIEVFTSADIAVWSTLYPIFKCPNLFKEYLSYLPNINNWMLKLENQTQFKDAISVFKIEGGQTSYNALLNGAKYLVPFLMNEIQAKEKNCQHFLEAVTTEEFIAAKNAWGKDIEQLPKLMEQKEVIYSAKEPPHYPTCNHQGKTYRCKMLKMSDIREFHSAFYSSTVKEKQDAFLLKYINIRKPRRDRAQKENSSRKTISIEYFVKIKNTEKFQMQVCQKSFLNILNVSKSRIQRIARQHLETGQLPTEKRGGARIQPIYIDKKKAVKHFIEQLQCSEVHYCREKTKRQYLPCDVNIKKLFEAYNSNAPDELKVKRSFFRKIFNCDYNIGFGAPVTDACSRCIELTERIKVEKDNALKANLIMEKRVHKLRSKTFFEILREEKPGMVTFSYDCQKNLVSPKVPDQIAYYSRQLYTYNFTVVKGTSHSKLTTENVFTYTWMEHEYKKGSNEIASAVFHLLASTDLSNVDTIRLCADGCGGQNRNSTMVAMIVYFLSKIAPTNLKCIQLIFPVRGHSFLPSDRVFGRIEKSLKKMPVITDPATYTELFSRNSIVTKLEDCVVKDWKSTVQNNFKVLQSWHFKISQAKRIIIEKGTSNIVTVRGEEYYRNDLGEQKSLFKRGKNVNTMLPVHVEKGVPIKPLKLSNIKTLLTAHFGQDWKKNNDCTFFKNFVESYNELYVENFENTGDDTEDFCEATEEPRDLRI